MQTLAELSPESRELALSRFRMLEPHLREARPLRPLALAAGIPFRTAQRWVALYRREGLTGLVRKSRRDRATQRVVSPRMRKAIEGLALERHRLVRDLPAALLTLAHEGEKAYSEAFDLVHRREAKGPNAIWQVDHCLLDIPLLGEDGSVAKPWLTIVIDDYSRAVAGYYLAFGPPSTLRSSLAIRQGIWRKGDPHWPVCGIPEVLYMDNGSDFRSDHIEQVAADLKMRLIFSTPGKPRGRGRIERFFRTVHDMFLCSLDGYLARSRKNPKLTLAMLEEQFRAFLLEVYHRNPGEETAKPPVERWEAGGFLPRMPESLEQLDLLLLYAIRSRKVRPDGIHFERLRYLSPTLAAYVGEEVAIRYDPRDMGEIRVFYQDKFLCRAVAADLAGEIVSLKEIQRARNHRRRELRTILADRRQAVDMLIEIKRGLIDGSIAEAVQAKPPLPADPSPQRLKRYRNE